MEHQRPHLDRAHGDVERGFADTLVESERLPIHSGPHGAVPAWLLKWEASRPVWLIEMVAETVGVFLYVFLGIGATASFLVTSAAKIAGFGNLFTIGLSYGGGAAFGLTAAAPVSGGHLSPGFTIALAIFKGFPARKIPQYIAAQIFGGYLAGLCVYLAYKPSLDAVAAGYTAAGEAALIFSSSGPAGVFALFPNVGTNLKYTFFNELMANIVLSLVVFCVIDPRNPFVGFRTGPLIIGFAYAVVIWAFAAESVALNTARDLGGRMACATVYGSKCFTTSVGYTALAALTNIPGILIGGMLHTLFLADNAKPVINAHVTADDASNGSMRELTRDGQEYRKQM